MPIKLKTAEPLGNAKIRLQTAKPDTGPTGTQLGSEARPIFIGAKAGEVPVYEAKVPETTYTPEQARQAREALAPEVAAEVKALPQAPPISEGRFEYLPSSKELGTGLYELTGLGMFKSAAEKAQRAQESFKKGQIGAGLLDVGIGLFDVAMGVYPGWAAAQVTMPLSGWAGRGVGKALGVKGNEAEQIGQMIPGIAAYGIPAVGGMATGNAVQYVLEKVNTSGMTEAQKQEYLQRPETQRLLEMAGLVAFPLGMKASTYLSGAAKGMFRKTSPTPRLVTPVSEPSPAVRGVVEQAIAKGTEGAPRLALQRLLPPRQFAMPFEMPVIAQTGAGFIARYPDGRMITNPSSGLPFFPSRGEIVAAVQRDIQRPRVLPPVAPQPMPRGKIKRQQVLEQPALPLKEPPAEPSPVIPPRVPTVAPEARIEAAPTPTTPEIVQPKVTPKVAEPAVPTEAALAIAPALVVPPEAGPGTTPEAVHSLSIEKMMQALKESKPLRREQAALYSAARSKKMARALAVGEGTKGEKGYYMELGQLKGEMPKVQQFEELRSKIGQADINNLFNEVKNNKVLGFWDSVTARSGLVKLLEGRVPTERELVFLNEVFPKDFIDIVLSKRSLFTKFKEAGYELANIPRAVMSSFDLSAPFRQGLFLISHPKRFFGAFPDMFRAFGSEEAFKAIQESIARKPTFDLMRKNRLALTEMGKMLLAREERFMSSWAEKIPLAGRAIRASGRAYTGFLNKLRADVFEDLVTQADKLGRDPRNNPKLTKEIANFVNIATGRGDIGKLQAAAVGLNSFFFSPRLMASRLTLLNPLYYIKADPFIRKEALKSLFVLTGTTGTILSLAKMAGAEVNLDPRSADFAKIKLGNTRIDLLGGFQQYIRSASQFITGTYVSTTTGKETVLGEGYKPLTRLDILLRAVESKEAPVFSFLTDFLRGQDYAGKPLNIPKEVASRFVPMAIGDIVDIYKDDPSLLPVAALGIFGVGLQTYQPSARSAIANLYAQRLLSQGVKLPSPKEVADMRREIINLKQRGEEGDEGARHEGVALTQEAMVKGILTENQAQALWGEKAVTADITMFQTLSAKEQAELLKKFSKDDYLKYIKYAKTGLQKRLPAGEEIVPTELPEGSKEPIPASEEITHLPGQE